LKANDIKAKKKTKEIANARQIAMYIAKQLTAHSLSEIGKNFGGKGHATVIYSCKQIEEEMGRDNNFKNMVEVIIKRLK
ncbi:MAG: chromosomal replication initiator protein DnaA, partial [Nitrospirae bacterium]|nr:chromosomal replication initiator protein DnaA [Nitrospirota bacterium]